MMGKTCAFLGNDYGLCQPTGLIDVLVAQIRRLITEEGVDTFLVGEKAVMNGMLTTLLSG